MTFCLLAALAFSALIHPDAEGEKVASGGVVDCLGRSWFIACLLCPLLQWAIAKATADGLTLETWRTLFLIRVLVGSAPPLLLALRVSRSFGRRLACIQVPVIVVFTGLAILPISWAARDLVSGPSRLVETDERTGARKTLDYLPHTGRVLGTRRQHNP